MKKILLLFFLLGVSYQAQADCRKINDTCTVDILSLRPAQFSVGLKEVDLALENLRSLSAKKLQKEIAKKPALVVLGPQQSLFVVDRNHFARELLSLNVSQMQALVIDDASNLNWDDFWTYVKAHNEVYLYDEKGYGPLSPDLLPKNILALSDDPYRSLAVMARDQNCYDKSSVLFADFQWAQFFRARISMTGLSDADYQQALSKALQLCHSQEAANLPGFNP